MGKAPAGTGGLLDGFRTAGIVASGLGVVPYA